MHVDSQSESSDAASTIKRWDNRWMQTEGYDSSGTTSTSEQGDDFLEDCHATKYDFLGHNNVHGFCKSQGCLCQACLLGYARVIALQGSLPNVCTAANAPNYIGCSNTPFYNAPCSSIPTELPCNVYGCSLNHRSCKCQMPQNMQHVNRKMFDATNLTGLENSNRKIDNNCQQNNRCVGSLDRRKKRLKNKVDREHRTKSQNDLICCEQKNTSHYCSLQQFHHPKNLQSHNDYSNTEERLRKLENERSALQWDIGTLSEQLFMLSGKITELENDLQEKKDALRHMEETLQKEVLSRSALETQKLELLSSLSEMKLKQANLERENMALRSSSPLSNGERFSRHAGHYSSLPRPPTSTKKGVIFADDEKTVIADITTYVKPTVVKPFVKFSIEEVSEWLVNLGLEAYINELKRWGATGSKLLEASNSQLEKELDIKNVLHKKKLLYAIESERCNGAGFLGSDKMDNAAVLRWLDDIGLPQHKEAFHNAKVDGRVLHRLTTEDLLILKVGAELHAASLRRGIQVLRELNFEFDNLERRSGCENSKSALCEGSDKSNDQVSLWTNHRVMEWLRVVDLAEYAPNMRGSGVHGGLMVYEHRFTSELLATLLSIPPAKTLLRRHLTTHFNQIVGREVVQQKREMENTLGFVPLTLTARLKIPKRTQFTLKRKKSKNEVDFGNLVCPLEGSPPGTPSTPSTSPSSPNLNSPIL